MRLRKVEHINAKRLELNSQGYIRKTQLKDYIGCGQAMADRAWSDITLQILKEGKSVSPFGIEPKRVMDYLHLTEAQIDKYAARGM